MPESLRAMLEKGAKISITNQISQDGRLIRIESVSNEIRGIVPVLAQLCAQDDRISRAYLCHPDVTDVVKMSREGGFCGFVLPLSFVSFLLLSLPQDKLLILNLAIETLK